jgi:hypothetical protein
MLAAAAVPRPRLTDGTLPADDVAMSKRTSFRRLLGRRKGPKVQPGPLTGIWLSSYECESTGRGATFAGRHYVAVVQHGSRLQVRSLPASRSRLLMDLTANGQVLTGTWTEETNPAGYYHGAVYHGAIQLLLEPTGRKMTGKWVGFGPDFDLNTGPWGLELVTNSVTGETMQEYSRPVDGD